MNLSSAQDSSKNFSQTIAKLKPRRGMAFGLIILTALVAFEIFNYSTTDYALRDLLGDLRFAGVRWATILALAFCGIDFAGIARLFTPEKGNEEPKEVWYLFGAWLLAATMNAVLTWWGVSMAITTHSLASKAMVDPKTIMTVVPIFVSLMVWVIRILLIGSLSVAGDRIFSDGQLRSATTRPPSRSVRPSVPVQANLSGAAMASRSIPRPGFSTESSAPRPEPTYHSVNARPARANSNSDNSSYQL